MNLKNKDIKLYNKVVNQYIRQKMQEPKIQLIIVETVLNHPDTFKHGICKINNLEKEELEK